MPSPPFDDPFTWFEIWYADAFQKVSPNPNAMALATADAEGRPSSRIVLLKSWTEEGFVFHTNRRSRKGSDIAVNPHAALTFYWRTLDRQIRIEGSVTELSDADSDAYFATRPRGSQIGAWASDQSEPLESLEAILQRVDDLEQRYPEEVPRPAHWGGYVVAPRRIEFWEQGDFRIHTRWAFERRDYGWSATLLNP